MLHQGLILTSQREYAQAMRTGLVSLGDEHSRVDIELDALRARHYSFGANVERVAAERLAASRGATVGRVADSAGRDATGI